MRSFTIIAAAAFVGSVVALPGQPGYGPPPPISEPSYPEPTPAPSTTEEPVYVTETAVTTVQSCPGYGGCGGETPVPVPETSDVYSAPAEETSYPPSETTPAGETPYPPPAETTGNSGEQPPVSESPCPTAETVTVTISSGVPYPTGGVTSNSGEQPTGTGYPVPLPTYTGAASHANAGMAIAGMGAIAAFFL